MARLIAAAARIVPPVELGYCMPAEWEPHFATWLAWPHERTDWPGKFEPIPWIYADIVRLLARVERLRILVQDALERREATRILKKSGANLRSVDFFVVPTNRGWIRDFGPIFIKSRGLRRASPKRLGLSPNHAQSRFEGGFARTRSGGLGITDWRFNAWAKYKDWPKDDAATSQLAPRLKLPVWQPLHASAHLKSRRVVLEGGSIDVNGLGTLLTTEECLLSKQQQRNPGFTRKDYEAVFRDSLGVTNVLWLGRGIAGDDTHGHVDDLARFVNPRTVVTVVESNRSDPNFVPLRENLARLRKMKDQNGRPLRVETLPMPEPVYFAGQRLPASYANFYIANRLVLVPVFNDPNDRAALTTLKALFPERDVVGVPCRDLVLGLGTLHCMTQQQPA